MALTRIDRRLVERLVVTELNRCLNDIATARGSAGPTLIPPGRPQPGDDGVQSGDAGDAGMWCRIVAIDVDRLPRQRSDGEPDHQQIVITVGVHMNAALTKSDAYALSLALGDVADALGERTIRDGSVEPPVAATHQIDVIDQRTIEDPDTDGRGVRTGAVVFTGTVCRF